jgi:RHS repeat-associated protein
MTNASGVAQERYTYSTFGKLNVFDAAFNVRTASACSITRTFTGQVRDNETGLMLYRNRVYHPTLGRFVQRDPIGYAAGDVNLVRYVKNQTLIFLDEFGLSGGFPMPYPSGKDPKDINPTPKPYPQNLSACCRACGNAVGAWALALVRSSRYDDRDDHGGGNAFKHCVANCRTVRACGEECAKDFWDGYEGNGTGIESRQDLHNNEIGRQRGSYKGGSCLYQCFQAWASGEFKCQDKTGSYLVTCPTPHGGSYINRPDLEDRPPRPGDIGVIV